MVEREGDSEYRPSSYKDLLHLPIILVVVEKGEDFMSSKLLIFYFSGKMGITYPKSLRFYDLRMRYTTTESTTRRTIEQDFGRACR